MIIDYSSAFLKKMVQLRIIDYHFDFSRNTKIFLYNTDSN